MNTDIVVALIAAGVSLAAAALAYWRAANADRNTSLLTRSLEHANELSKDRYEKLYQAYRRSLMVLAEEPVLRTQDRDGYIEFLSAGVTQETRIEEWLDSVRPILPEGLLRELDDQHEIVTKLNTELVDAVEDKRQDRSADWWPLVELLNSARLGYLRAVVDTITKEIRRLAIPPLDTGRRL